MMKKLLAVARWEYVEKVKSKAFIISIILMPVIMIGFGVVPTLFAVRPDSEVKVIGLIDPQNKIGIDLSRLLEERFRLPDGTPNYLVQFIEGSSVAKQKQLADSLVHTARIEGYVIVQSSLPIDSAVEYRTQNVGNIKVIERLNSAIRDVIVEQKLRNKGLNPDIINSITTSVNLRTYKLSETGDEQEAGFGEVFLSAYLFMMMMFFLVVTSGQLLVRSMLEEKSNRVVEVLMSSASARDLMGGKIIGLSGLGLTQLAIWGIIALAISMKFGVTFVSVSGGAILFVYFVLGYLLYAAVFVTAGAPVSTEQEAQQITSYLTIILVVPIALAIPVLENPNSLMVKILTFIPLLTPTMMAMRIPVQMPSTSEIAITMTVLAIAALTMIWIAGKVFRTTILLYGKRPSVKELFHLIRSA